jgi:hypothetical protein
MSGKKQSPTPRRPQASLTPAPKRNLYFHAQNNNNSFITSLEEIEKKVLNVITDVEDKLAYLKAHPKHFYPSEQTTYKKHTVSLCPSKSNKVQNSPFKLCSKSIEKKIEKFTSRKNSMVKLMQSTNSFKLPKIYKEGLMNKLIKKIDKYKKPCIQGLFSEIINKESIFEGFKNRNVGIEELKPSEAYGQICDQEKNAPLPVLTRTQDSALVLNRYNIGKGIALALSKAISLMPYIKQVHLDENGISDKAGAELLKGLVLNGEISSFYYTRNEIGPNFISAFQEFSQCESLVELNFKGCKATGQQLIDLVWSLRFCKSLKKLILAELPLSAISIEKLAKVLEASKIMLLDLSWNTISQEASIILFTGLQQNSSLKFLDYSWNPLTDSDQTEALCRLIKNHKSLMHLNLSQTKIPNAAPYLSAIHKAKHLIGLHLTGNGIDASALPAQTLPKLYPNSAVYFDMPTKAAHTFYNLSSRDNNGRLKIAHKDSVINTMSPKKTIDKHLLIDPKEVILSRVLGQDDDLKGLESWGISEHCWICERWGIYRLKVTLDSLQQVATPDIFYSRTLTGKKLVMKPSFNNWKDIEFELVDDTKGEYEVNILIPSGKHRFLIIKDDSSVCVTRKVSAAKWKKLLVNEFTMPLRELEIALTGEMTLAVAQLFDKNKSVFRNFLEETEAIVKASFESDMKIMRPGRIVREMPELNKLLVCIGKNYAKIKAIYLELIITQRFPIMGTDDLWKLCEKIKVFDEDFTQAKFDLICEQMSFDKSENQELRISRCGFVEFLIRVVTIKYSTLELSVAEKFAMFLTNHLFKYTQQARTGRFRKEKLYNLEVNDLLEKNGLNLQTLLLRYKEGDGRWLSINGAMLMFESVKWEIPLNVVIRMFAYSKMAVINEMNEDGAYDRLQFVEFIEFLCRSIDWVVKEEQGLDQKLLFCLPQILEANKVRFTVKLTSSNLGQEL